MTVKALGSKGLLIPGGIGEHTALHPLILGINCIIHPGVIAYRRIIAVLRIHTGIGDADGTAFGIVDDLVVKLIVAACDGSRIGIDIAGGKKPVGFSAVLTDNRTIVVSSVLPPLIILGIIGPAVDGGIEVAGRSTGSIPTNNAAYKTTAPDTRAVGIAFLHQTIVVRNKACPSSRSQLFFIVDRKVPDGSHIAANHVAAYRLPVCPVIAVLTDLRVTDGNPEV